MYFFRSGVNELVVPVKVPKPQKCVSAIVQKNNSSKHLRSHDWLKNVQTGAEVSHFSFNPFLFAGANHKITCWGPWIYFKIAIIFDVDLNNFIFVVTRKDARNVRERTTVM